MFRLSPQYYQIYRVDHKRNHHQMIAEIAGLKEADKLVATYLRNLTAIDLKDEISYYRSTYHSNVPKMLRRAS